MTSDPTAALRAAILAGEFAPGQRLVQSDLVERFGVARAGVRDALATLVVEGLVETTLHKGARVRAVSREEAIEISELRMVVESFLAGRAAERVDDDGRRALRAQTAAMRDAVASGDLLGYSRANQLLHAVVLDLSGQRTAQRVVETLRSRDVRRQFRLALRPGRAAVSLGEHEEIVEAICAGDAPRAERAMRAHLASVIAALRELGDDPAPPL